MHYEDYRVPISHNSRGSNLKTVEYLHKINIYLFIYNTWLHDIRSGGDGMQRLGVTFGQIG